MRRGTRSLAGGLLLVAFGLAGCEGPPEAEGSTAEKAAALANNGGHGACTAQQSAGGYEDVDGECLLTCWNCSGDVGGSGPVSGGGSGGGSSGGGAGGGPTDGQVTAACRHECDTRYRAKGYPSAAACKADLCTT